MRTILVLMFASTAQAQIPTDGIASRWTFDDDRGGIALDDGQRDNDGMAYGATFTGDVPVITGGGRAAQFDGDGDRIAMSDKPYFAPGATFTLAFWARPTRLLGPLTESTSGLSPATLPFAIVPANEEDEFGQGHSSIGVAVGTDGVAVVERTPGERPVLLVHETPVPAWTHVVVVVVANRPTLYLDGTAVRTGLASPRTLHPSAKMGQSHIGEILGPYAGVLDDVIIYTRELTPPEIRGMSFRPPDPVDPGPGPAPEHSGGDDRGGADGACGATAGAGRAVTAILLAAFAAGSAQRAPR